MSQYRVSAHAQTDIDEIWDYIGRDNPAAATRFTVVLADKFTTIVRQPRLGRPRDDVTPGLRRFTVGKYAIWYRIPSDHVEIARVLHSARDIEHLFNPE